MKFCLTKSSYAVVGFILCTVPPLVPVRLIALKAHVKPSQRLSQKPHEAWVVFDKAGNIITGHCTCMAG